MVIGVSDAEYVLEEINKSEAFSRQDSESLPE
jgi:hypothetical protein